MRYIYNDIYLVHIREQLRYNSKLLFKFKETDKIVLLLCSKEKNILDKVFVVVNLQRTTTIAINNNTETQIEALIKSEILLLLNKIICSDWLEQIKLNFNV